MAPREATKDWTQQDYLDAQRRGEELDDKVLAVMRAGAVDNQEFKARYDAKALGLAEYLRDATAAYATQRLS